MAIASVVQFHPLYGLWQISSTCTFPSSHHSCELFHLPLADLLSFNQAPVQQWSFWFHLLLDREPGLSQRPVTELSRISLLWLFLKYSLGLRDINGNSFSSSIPSSVGTLLNLQYLYSHFHLLRKDVTETKKLSSLFLSNLSLSLCKSGVLTTTSLLEPSPRRSWISQTSSICKFVFSPSSTFL